MKKIKNEKTKIIQELFPLEIFVYNKKNTKDINYYNKDTLYTLL
jgi:hypothetical protein